jgi:hypothetical protein
VRLLASLIQINTYHGTFARPIEPAPVQLEASQPPRVEYIDATCDPAPPPLTPQQAAEQRQAEAERILTSMTRPRREEWDGFTGGPGEGWMPKRI